MNQIKAGRPKKGANDRSDVQGFKEDRSLAYDSGKNGTNAVRWHRDQQKLLSPCDDVMTRVQRETWAKIVQDRIDVWFGLEVVG